MPTQPLLLKTMQSDSTGRCQGYPHLADVHLSPGTILTAWAHWCVLCHVLWVELVIQTVGSCAHTSVCLCNQNCPGLAVKGGIRHLQVFADVLCLALQFVCCITDIDPEVIQSLPVYYA